MAREQVLYRMLPAETIEKGSCTLCAMSHMLGSLSRLRGALIQGYLVKLPKFKYKERILKAAREKQLVTYKGAPIRLAADFPKETTQDRRA